MTDPVHSLRRAGIGIAHALALNTGTDRRWAVIDLYGDVNEFFSDALRTDDEVSEWELVFTSSAVCGIPCPFPVPPGTLRMNGDWVAVRTMEGWELYDRTLARGYVNDPSGTQNTWTTVYVPAER